MESVKVLEDVNEIEDVKVLEDVGYICLLLPSLPKLPS